jgi:alkanesulfonate monooxygenase SsuD/methylene tetrahydromethanopterin reductase-like flavin-dependent oxidoreductase (luciferase family)
MVRRTRKEAEDYHHYIVHEQGDWESAEYALNLRGQRVKSWFTTDDEKKMKARLISGAGFPLVGSYDDAVETMQRLHGAGLDGLALGMINYVNDFPAIRDELLPRMERVGLREPQHHGAAQHQDALRNDDLVH